MADFGTIGSPLGLSLVRRNVHRERESHSRVPVRTPTVAIDARLHDDYGPNDRGVRVEGDAIFNSYRTPEGKRNSHKSYGYLRTPELLDHIRDAL